MRETLILRIVAEKCRIYGCLMGWGSDATAPRRVLNPPNTEKANRCKHKERKMPNTSKRTTVKSVRLKNEICELIDSEGTRLNRLIESLYEAVSEGRINIKDDEVRVATGRVKKGYTAFYVREDIGEDLSNMLEIYGVNAEQVLMELQRAIDEGEIDIDNGRFVYIAQEG